ncbi:lipopolysaccharide biosynthesis protein [Psychromonas sp. PT13]|uniref:lipopolysaccharide biosynthesis protein n=1 Tax=Psychromonas sp. PT13 TaxID=3439547 RepID=UPI003EBAE83A
MKNKLKRIYASVGANIFAQAVTIIIQLASVPIILSQWSLSVYGQWLMLTAIPSYFALSDLGFLTVIVNKMTILSGQKKHEKVKSLFHSAILLCFGVITFSLVSVSLVCFFIDNGVLNLINNKLALIVLVMTGVLSLTSRLVDAVFRSQGEFALGAYLLQGIRILEWSLLLLGIVLFNDFLSAALLQLAGRVIGLGVVILFASNRHKNLNWSIKDANKQDLKELIKPALSFMSFPVANAFSFQGMTICIGVIFGPAYLAIFNTYRTVSRIIVQCVNVVSNSIGPELSRQFGEGNNIAINSIHSKGRIITILSSLAVCFFLTIFGQFLLHLWVGDKIPYEAPLFYGFLTVAFLNASWQIELVYLTSLNRHMKISLVYLFASLLMLTMLYIIGNDFGHLGPIAALSTFELIVGYWCFKIVYAYKQKL